MFDLVVLPGLVPYEEALALQHRLVAERQSGARSDTLILLEHPPVITLGRNADPAGVTASYALLERLGITVHRVERGGQATYHGPGQIVGYPIAGLHGLRIGVAAYVRRLEEVMIRAAASFSVESFCKPGIPGVFTAAGKLGAVGVRVSRGVAFHGFAFNVDPDLTHYRLIVPCGMTDTRVTSLAALLGVAPPREDAFAAVAAAFVKVFDGAAGDGAAT